MYYSLVFCFYLLDVSFIISTEISLFLPAAAIRAWAGFYFTISGRKGELLGVKAENRSYHSLLRNLALPASDH